MNKLTALCLALAASTVSSAALAGPVATKRWWSGFEWENVTPPGEFDYMDTTIYVPTTQTAPNSGLVTAWTYVDAAQAPGIVTVGHAYKGWVTGVASASHRPYPSMTHSIPGPVIVNQFVVYLDTDNVGEAVGSDHWIQFVTLGNVGWGSNLVRLNVDDGKVLALDDVAPFDYVGPSPQPNYPSKKWVTFTVYMDFEATEQTWHVWQDGVHILQYKHANPGGSDLVVAHWGMYSGENVASGSQYNDDIALWSLSEPLTSFDAPPPNPYGISQQGMSGTGSSGAGTGGGGTGAGGSGAGGAGGSATTGTSGTSTSGATSASTTGAGGAGGATGSGGGGGPEEGQSGACSAAPSRGGSGGAWIAGALALLFVARRRRSETVATRPVPGVPCG